MITDGEFNSEFCDTLVVALDVIHNIGTIAIVCYGEGCTLELLKIDESFRGKGYGTTAILELIDLCKSKGIEYITGDCRQDLVKFYKSLGAKIECRCKEDYNFINEKFYIDIECQRYGKKKKKYNKER